MDRYVRPIYPKAAKRQHIQGKVKLCAVVTVRGEVRDIEVLERDPMFVAAALRAVKRWRYAPCLLNGDAIELKTNIEIPFTLTQ
jgi:protein TonB